MITAPFLTDSHKTCSSLTSSSPSPYRVWKSVSRHNVDHNGFAVGPSLDASRTNPESRDLQTVDASNPAVRSAKVAGPISSGLRRSGLYHPEGLPENLTAAAVPGIGVSRRGSVEFSRIRKCFERVTEHSWLTWVLTSYF